MKKDKFAGYINYQNEEHDFIFENYELQIYPTTSEKLIMYKTTLVFDKLSKPKKHGWINDVNLDGTTFEGKKVTFCVQDLPRVKDGVASYKVKWLYIYEKQDKNGNSIIKGLKFESKEINQFYNVSKFISDDFNLNEKGGFKDYTLKLKNMKQEKLGHFKYKNYGVTIFGEMAFSKKYTYMQNLDIWSIISLDFSKNVTDLNKAIDVIVLQNHVVDFLTYRLNNSFEKIESYYYDSNNRRVVSGQFYYPFEANCESDEKLISHMISCNNIPNIGMIYTLILNEKLYIPYLCNSIKERNKYYPQRMLGIFIAFERVFSWMCPEKELRGAKYIAMVDNLKELLINNKQKLVINSNTKYLRELLRELEKSKRSINYKDKFDYALKKYSLSKKYISNMYMKDENTDDISYRLNIIRNALAHGKRNVEFDSINTIDLKLIEILIYIMILDYLKIEENEIISKVNWLFNISTFVNSCK